MKVRLAAFLVLACSAPPAALAQTAPQPGDTVVPETPAAAAQGSTTCTDVQVGSAQSYDCLNAQLRAQAGAEPKPSSLDAPLSATSPGYKTGAANAAATANRLGANYGKSVTPQRPPTPVYVNPLTTPR